MSVQLKLTPKGGVQSDISSSINWDSINLNLVLTKEVSTLDFSISQALSDPVTIPEVGDAIDLYEDQDSGNVHIFGGTVTDVSYSVDGGFVVLYTISVTDWSYTFDSLMVAKVYTDMDPGDIVSDIIANYCPGFTDTNVKTAGYTIPSIKFNYQPPTKCIQKIATLIGWDWYIDPSKDVHFFIGNISGGVGSGATAPFNLDDTSGNFQWPTTVLNTNSQNLKNSVTVIGSTYKKTYDATSAIDKYVTVATVLTYPLVYPYDTGTIQVTVDGVSKTVGILGQDSPGSFDVLYSNASGSPPFIVFSADPGAGHTLKVFGDAEIPILAYANDAASITAYGEFQDTVVDKQITTFEEAQLRAIAEVIQFGEPINELKFSTLKTGLMIGQSITLNSTLLGINLTLIIKRINGTGYTPTELRYTVEAVGVGTSKVSFVDIMAVLLEQELNQNSVDDSTVLEVLLRAAESLAITDAVSTPTTSSPPYVWGGDWLDRVAITVNHAKVSGGGSITAFPVYLDLSLLPAAFFNGYTDSYGVVHPGVKSDGSDIRIYKSDNTTQVPVEIVSINTGAKTGEAWFKGDISGASDTTFYLWYANPAASMPAANSTYGSQNVWSNYQDIYHLKGNANDSASAGKNGTLTLATQASDSVSFPGEVALDSSISGASTLAFGKTTTYQKIAQSFTPTSNAAGQVDSLVRKIASGGTPTSTITVAVVNDSGGSPTGSTISSTTISSANWAQNSTSIDNIVWTSSGLTSLTNGTKYWLVFSVDVTSDTNYYNLAYDGTASHGVLKTYDGAAWNTQTGALRFGVYKSGYVHFSSTITQPYETCAIYFRLKKTDTNYESVIANTIGSTQGHLEINGYGNTPSPNKISVRPPDSDGQLNFSTGINVGDGAYHDYLYVFDATSVRFYVDGTTLTGQPVFATSASQTWNYLGIIQNRMNSTYGAALTGNLQDVMFMSPATASTDVNWAVTRRNNASAASTFFTIGSVGSAYPNQLPWGFGTWSA